MRNAKVDFSMCFAKCEGMDIISYNSEDLSKNQRSVRNIRKLSHMYNKYKGTYQFTSNLINVIFEVEIFV